MACAPCGGEWRDGQEAAEAVSIRPPQPPSLGAEAPAVGRPDDGKQAPAASTPTTPRSPGCIECALRTGHLAVRVVFARVARRGVLCDGAACVRSRDSVAVCPGPLSGERLTQGEP